jgi:hypothetical protein
VIRSTMRLSFATEQGETYTVDVDPSMELENVTALLEAEVCRGQLEASKQSQR